MHGPYAFINEQPKPYPLLKLELSLSPHAEAKFDALNQHIRNTLVLPGQLVIVGDIATRSCTTEEAHLMRAAQNVKLALLSYSAVDGFLVKHYDSLQTIMSLASTGIGSTSSAWSKHLAGIEHTLKDIDSLHKDYLSKGSLAARNEFLIKRRDLFSRLGEQLRGMARFGTGLKNHGSIKKMLGISSKSYWHQGEIRGYEQTIRRIAKTSQMLKKGTYIGLALDVGVTALEITEACSTGREQECTRAKYVEGSKLAFGVAGAYAGGYIAAPSATIACAIVFGIPTAGAGALACAVVGGVAGGVGGAMILGELGETIGTRLYESTRD